MALAARAADYLGRPDVRALTDNAGYRLAASWVRHHDVTPSPTKTTSNAPRSVCADKKASCATSGRKRPWHDHPLPLGGFAGILLSYGTLSGALALALRRKGAGSGRSTR